MTPLDILLVEDEDPKRIHVTSFIQECADNVSIATAKSVNSALEALEDNVPDLLLLDMSLPTFDVGDGEPGVDRLDLRPRRVSLLAVVVATEPQSARESDEKGKGHSDRQNAGKALREAQAGEKRYEDGHHPSPSICASVPLHIRA